MKSDLNIHVHKDIFACLFSIHNTISLSCHEQEILIFMIRCKLQKK